MNLRVTVTGEAKRLSRVPAVKASVNSAMWSVAVDAKPSDLHMSRVKFR